MYMFGLMLSTQPTWMRLSQTGTKPLPNLFVRRNLSRLPNAAFIPLKVVKISANAVINLKRSKTLILTYSLVKLTYEYFSTDI